MFNNTKYINLYKHYVSIHYQTMSFNTSAQQSGRVVVNARLSGLELNKRKRGDRSTQHLDNVYPHATLEDSYLSVAAGEPLFISKNGVKRQKGLSDTNLEVYSSLNGILKKKGKSLEEVESTLQCVGFADIPAKFTSGSSRRENTVVQVGGIRTTTNTGVHMIHVGDVLHWNLPKKATGGRNKKILAELNPVKKWANWKPDSIVQRITRAEPDDVLYKYLVDNGLAISGDGLKDFARHTAALLKIYDSEMRKKQRHVVGVAMSDGKPGQEIDIKIGSYSI